MSEPKLWVPLGHYYSPVVDVADFEKNKRTLASPVCDLPGIDLRVEEQWNFYESLKPYLRSASFAATSNEAHDMRRRYYAENPSFGDGDASIYEAMLRLIRPNKVFELGCGFSSALLLDVRDRYLAKQTKVTLVDPYTDLLRSLLLPEDLLNVEILSQRTQDVDLKAIQSLSDRDILFIDSTHVAKTDSDVLRIFHEILPEVASGVIVHLHDHFAGFEYPLRWIHEGRSWNEQYLTRAFLQYNNEFQILLWPHHLQLSDFQRYSTDVPYRRNSGASLYLRRR